MITFIKKQKNKLKNKGFTLLFAVLVSTLIISISASVISIALRQTIISGTTRESQYAFYAANTVLECAFYWDVIGVPTASTGVIFPSLTSESRIDVAETGDVTCAGGNIVTGSGFTEGYATGWDDNGDETTIRIEIKDVTADPVSSRTICAQAVITKSEDASGIITTVIEANGYNTCDLTSPRAVERGLIQSYQS